MEWRGKAKLWSWSVVRWKTETERTFQIKETVNKSTRWDPKPCPLGDGRSGDGMIELRWVAGKRKPRTLASIPSWYQPFHLSLAPCPRSGNPGLSALERSLRHHPV